LENLENRTIAGAIVDVNLRDRDIMPVIHALIAANIPFVVYTANGLPPEFTRQNPFLPVMLKPSYAPDVARRLLDEMVRHRPAG
jgi:hypothetical protein